MSKKKVLCLKNIKKTFKQGSNNIKILKSASLEIEESEIVALIGQSGSGKSTLLQIAGLLDKADMGSVIINNKNYSKASDSLKTYVRRNEIGFVYQFHHLLAEFTAVENLVIPQIIAGIEKNEAIEHAKELLKFLGLGKRTDHRPSELSGGEQQRVAIARSLINKPSLLLADEPTGNLDPNTSDEVFNLLIETVKAVGLSVLIVTHNMSLAKRVHRTVSIEDGVIV